MNKKRLQIMLNKGFNHIERTGKDTYLFRLETEDLQKNYTYVGGQFIEKRRKFTKKFIVKVKKQQTELVEYVQKHKKYASYGSTYKIVPEWEKLLKVVGKSVNYEKLLQLMKQEVLERNYTQKVPDLVVDLFMRLEKVNLHCFPAHKYFFEFGTNQIEVVYTKNVGIVSRLLSNGKVIEQRRKLYPLNEKRGHLKLPVIKTVQRPTLYEYVKQMSPAQLKQLASKKRFKNVWYGKNVMLYALAVAQDNLLSIETAPIFYKESNQLLKENKNAKIKRNRHLDIHMDDYQEAFVYLEQFMDMWNKIGMAPVKPSDYTYSEADYRQMLAEQYEEGLIEYDYGDNQEPDHETYDAGVDKEIDNPYEDYLSDSPETPWTDYDDYD